LISFLILFPKGQEFLFLNDYHNRRWDVFFKMITLLGDWPAYLLAFLFFFASLRWKSALLVLSMAILVPVLSQSSKAFFKHPRPGLFFKGKEQFNHLRWVSGVTLHKGLTSFPSGHTLSAFTVFSLLAFSFNGRKIQLILFIALPMLVGCSRIYLIQHFVEDVWMGSCMGFLLAFILYYFFVKENGKGGKLLFSGKGI
jgi:membrane-associated phospholipid phosphatase